MVTCKLVGELVGWWWLINWLIELVVGCFGGLLERLRMPQKVPMRYWEYTQEVTVMSLVVLLVSGLQNTSLNTNGISAAPFASKSKQGNHEYQKHLTTEMKECQMQILMCSVSALPLHNDQAHAMKRRNFLVRGRDV